MDLLVGEDVDNYTQQCIVESTEYRRLRQVGAVGLGQLLCNSVGGLVARGFCACSILCGNRRGPSGQVRTMLRAIVALFGRTWVHPLICITLQLWLVRHS